MKKAIFTLLLMAGLFNFTSCTEDSLAEATDTPEDYYANGEDENTDPEEEKPGGD
ncbi:MAG: hypothetical protein RI572_11995 [Salegentibacter sp.]|uniref:Secreted protein n=1 Tax=Salegentibacter flavus TaxID=287099 RepID=A0A1I5CC06_9FLAO|nr:MULTISPECIES: hypothetical protein [Salegentibacter]MDR9458120.1 hypothetical protein [Salegentibacter sp.]SFN84414.1 hypothetical protein SAMN05660413_02802 [Salegentibacter flavus]